MLKWRRDLIACKYNGSKRRHSGRPATSKEIEELVVRMAMENKSWGYLRIRGALSNLGYEVSRNTIANILKRNGVESALAGISTKANRFWMNQIARNLTDADDGLLNGKRYLIHDRDPLFTAEFLSTLGEVGVESVKLPPRAPNLNCYAERFVRSIKEGCLERMILFGKESLRTAVREFMAHYHGERNHQGLGNLLIIPDPELASPLQWRGPTPKPPRWNAELLSPCRMTKRASTQRLASQAGLL